ncbi:unnamed protein product [Urochloa humidicola]
MASASGNNRNGLTPYEQEREATIESNKRKIDALKLHSLSNELKKRPSSKRTKTTQKRSGAASEGHHNLRARPKRNHIEIAQEHIDCEPAGDFLCDNEEDTNSNPPKKRKVGKNARKFSSAIGCQVRKTISVACVDWRLVDAEKKYEVWTNIKAIYEVDDAAYNWFMDTSARKWKEFKSTLKKLYFTGKLSYEELLEKHADRVQAADWDFLIDYWMTPDCENQTKVCKENRGKLRLHHTSGSKSFASSNYELGEKLGRPARRDELFIKTHTRKNGVPSSQAEPIISKLKQIVEVYPELMEKTIQEGDVFAVVCGEKEPRGRVRGLGLGPTPQDVGTPGLRAYTPTRLQMEVLARKKIESEKAALERRIAEMQEAYEEERMARHNAEVLSQNGSNSRPHSQSPKSEGHVDEVNHGAENDDDGSDSDADQCDEDQLLVASRRSASPSTQ